MLDLGGRELLNPVPRGEFAAVEHLSEPKQVIHVGLSEDEATHAELSVIDQSLYLAQPNPVNPDIYTQNKWNSLYVDRANNQWYMLPLTETDQPVEQEGKVQATIEDIKNPRDEMSMLSPVGLVVLDQESSTFRFFPRIVQSSVWNGAKFEPKTVNLYTETEDQIHDFTAQGNESGWVNSLLRKERLMPESPAPHLSQLRETATRLTQILRGLNENSAVEIPNNMIPDLEYNYVTKQYLLTLHMHTQGVEDLIGLGRTQIREIGEDYGFGNRIIFLINDVVVPNPQDPTKIIRGSLYLQEYDPGNKGFNQTEVMAGVDIIGEAARRGTHWKLVANSTDPNEMKVSLGGLIRSLRARKKE